MKLVLSKATSWKTLQGQIKELEEKAVSYPGVLQSYAIQAGRELRVVVESEKVTDDAASKLAFEISRPFIALPTYMKC